MLKLSLFADRRNGRRYLGAALIAVLASALQYWLLPVIGAQGPFVFFLPAVALTAASLGPGPGLLLLAAGAANALLPGFDMPGWSMAGYTGRTRLLVYLLLGGLLMLMGMSVRNSRARAVAAEERLMTAIENTGIGVFDVDLRRRTISATPVLARILGLGTTTGGQYDTAPLGELSRDLVRAQRRQLRTQLARGHSAYEQEITLPHPDGHQTVGLLVRIRVIWQDLRPIGLRGACIDITKRQQIDAQLDSTRTQLNQLADDLSRLHALSRQLLAAPTLTEQLHLLLGVLTHCHGTERALVLVAATGPAPGDVLASTGFDEHSLARATPDLHGIADRACRERNRIMVDTSAGADDGFASERAQLRAHGIPALHVLPLISTQGAVLGAIVVCLAEPRAASERECTLADLCARKAVEVIDHARACAELQLTRCRYETVLETSGAPFVILKPVRGASGAVVDFVWEFLNPAAARALERNPAELIGRGVIETQCRAWVDSPPFQHCIRTVESDATSEFDAEVGTGADKRWFHCIASPTADGVGIWFTEISERMRHEQSLREGDRRKDEFLVTLAHELRNPLAPIRQATLLAMSPRATEAQRRWSYEVIDRQVSHMALLLDDLLDVSRITRGALSLRKVPTDLNSLFNSAMESVRPLIEAKGHRLIVTGTQAPILLEADPLRLSQVVANLLTNAAKYTEPGGFIRVHARRERQTVVFEVSDNGIGIAPEALDEVFRMFAQLPQTGPGVHSGLGIGLALSKGLVELHGGTLSAHSDGPGRGSVFTVRLPVGRQMATDASPARNGEPPPGTLCCEVLIADDNRDACDTLAELLKTEGHTVHIAYDGEQALQLWRRHRPHICLLDIGMPMRTGHEVAREIRRTPGGERVLLVAITGWGRLHDRDLALEAGFDLHLTKPVSPMQVSQLVQMQLRADLPREAADA